MPAEFIIPNCKRNSSQLYIHYFYGSTFTFTMDAFPDYTRFDKSKKYAETIDSLGTSDVYRKSTVHTLITIT